jgi:copper homeostasis protein
MIEAAVDTLDSALSAERAGAGRIELCASLNDGGTTPSGGLIATVCERLGIPVFVLIRPRGGNFAYTDQEVDVMRRDIDLASSFGAAGFATGALEPDNTIDIDTTRSLVAAAGNRPVTFHRAFDFTADLFAALEQLMDCGVKRVLTSGGARTALEGADTIARLVAQANGRITVVAGGGIRENNVREIIDRTGVTELHARITLIAPGTPQPLDRGIALRKPLPASESAHEEIDEKRMRQLVDLAALRSTSRQGH